MVADAGTLASDGAAFTSVTSSVMEASAFAAPSLTRTLHGSLPVSCASVGVHENTPVVPSMVAPVGAPTSENVSVCGGRSASLAVAVNVYAESSGIVADAGTFAIDGAVFTSVTVSVIAASALATPCVTRAVNV